MKSVHRSLFFSSLIAGLSLAPHLSSAADLTLYYYNRPPFMIPNSSHPSGYFIEKTELVMKLAGIDYVWEELPVNRLFILLEKSPEPICTSGFFLTPERAAIAQFSKPFYRTQRLVGIVRADSPIAETTNAKDLLTKKGLRVLTKQNQVFGAYIDSFLEKIPPEYRLVTSTAFENKLKMIYFSRADLTIMTPEEIDQGLKYAGLTSKDVKIVTFPDVPDSELRYILCSRSMSAQMMQKINKGIELAHLPN